MKYIGIEISHKLDEATRKKQEEFAHFAKMAGFTEFPLPRFNTKTSEVELRRNDEEFYTQLISNVVSAGREGDTFVMPYPLSVDSDPGDQITYQSGVLGNLQAKGVKVGLLVWDLPYYDIAAANGEIEEFIYFTRVDFVIVQTQAMKDWLIAQGLKKVIFTLDFLDVTSVIPMRGARFAKQISIVGNTVDRDLPLPPFVFNPEAPTGFGLVIEKGDELHQRYFFSEDISTFLAAGMPVIVKAGNPSAALIEQMDLGLVVSDYEVIPAVLESLTEDVYQTMVKRTQHFGQLLREGHFCQNVLAQLDGLEFLDEGGQRPADF